MLLSYIKYDYKIYIFKTMYKIQVSQGKIIILINYLIQTSFKAYLAFLLYIFLLIVNLYIS